MSRRSKLKPGICTQFRQITITLSHRLNLLNPLVTNFVVFIYEVKSFSQGFDFISINRHVVTASLFHRMASYNRQSSTRSVRWVHQRIIVLLKFLRSLNLIWIHWTAIQRRNGSDYVSLLCQLSYKHHLLTRQCPPFVVINNVSCSNIRDTEFLFSEPFLYL